MKLFEFYKVEENGKVVFYTYNKSADGGGTMFHTIIFGTSVPPHMTSVYDGEHDVATKKEIDNILKFRYKSMIQFVFEELNEAL